MTKRYLDKINRAATRGARHLDAVQPNWFTKIRVRELDMIDGNMCVCGQLARSFPSKVGALLREGRVSDVDCGDYTTGLVLVSVYKDENEAINSYRRERYLGFAAPDPPLSDCAYVTMDERYSRLTEAWLREIRTRRQAVRR